MDSAQESTLITGHEDAVVRLWDVRSGASEKTFKAQYEGHDKWISQVKFNQNVDNIFISGSYDGSVKLWDLRN
jgi:WD40 repeat protein